MYQPYPPSGQPAGPLRPPAPAPVLTAVKLMYAGAALSAVSLIISIISLADSIGHIKGAAHVQLMGHNVTAAHFRHLLPLIITLGIVSGLVFVIAPRLWMAWANGRGRNWARILSTVLFGLATLNLTTVFRTPGIRLGFGVTAPVPIAVLTWLVGLAVVWLLWRPAFHRVLQAGGLHAGRAQRTAVCRVAGAHCCAPAPSEPCVRVTAHTAQASLAGGAG